jgi:hypothetical protein
VRVLFLIAVAAVSGGSAGFLSILLINHAPRILRRRAINIGKTKP